MSKLTRRSFLGGAAVMPLALSLTGCGNGSGSGGSPPPAPAPGTPPPATPMPGARIRYDARSPEGQAMLQTYAQAVKDMNGTLAEGNPSNWVFQWYTHAVRSDRTKAGELARVFPAPGPQRDLANLMWSTCRPHFPGQPSDDFLPWHRMFVYYFEEIIRAVSGNNDFTLPYWDYSIADPVIHGVIPTEFRLDGDPTFGSLFVGKRNPGVNAGNAIDAGQPGDPLSTSALSECSYSVQSPALGFNRRLDRGLHGQVHVLTGNTMNMGDVPWAAGDPIFWLHHCNIDRLWASWNAAGRLNPTDPNWLNQQFVFADIAGNQVNGKTADFVDIAPLGYSYDRLEPVPACPPVSGGLDELAVAASPRLAAQTAQVNLSAAPVSVSLQPAAAQLGGQPALPLGDQVNQLQGKRLYVVAKGLATNVQPGVVYHVYLELPSGSDPTEAASYQIGTMNFFGAGHGAGHVDEDPSYSFDVTDLAKKLHAEQGLGASMSLTVAPTGTPASAAEPAVGEFSLVEQ